MRFSHSVFALPFALTGALLAIQATAVEAREVAWRVMWIIVAMVAARSAGMGFNRLVDAAYDARRLLRKVATYTQSPDHPVIPSIPETEYLKGFAFEVAR